MKKIIFLLLFIIALIQNIYGQRYNGKNSISRIALVYYYQDDKGFYHKKENVNLQEVFGVVSTYGYDKKAHELYVVTANSNCVVIVNDENHKILKKSKSIPQFKSEELAQKAASINEEMAKRYEILNETRQQQINDSIERAKQDSLRKVREDSIRRAAVLAREDNYRKNHHWFSVPTKKKGIYCEFCEKTVETGDSIGCYKIKNDTIYWMGTIRGYLDIPRGHMHVAKVPQLLASDTDYQYHLKVFRDSLEHNIEGLDMSYAAYRNLSDFEKYEKELKREAPHGLFLEWGWDDDYSIEFNFRYLNTNKNTIKYIEVFFVVTNDVGDVRKRGSFRGTGPLAEWESASWNWDHSSYYVAGDATKMNISQVIITYMNGSKVTLPKSKLRFN